jgi:hypothetical protein
LVRLRCVFHSSTAAHPSQPRQFEWRPLSFRGSIASGVPHNHRGNIGSLTSRRLSLIIALSYRCITKQLPQLGRVLPNLVIMYLFSTLIASCTPPPPLVPCHSASCSRQHPAMRWRSSASAFMLQRRSHFCQHEQYTSFMILHYS